MNVNTIKLSQKLQIKKNSTEKQSINFNLKQNNILCINKT